MVYNASFSSSVKKPSKRTNKTRHISLQHVTLLSLFAFATADLPYNPTRIFNSTTNNEHFLYILEPPSATAPKGQLLGLRAESTLESKHLPVTTVSPSLPFLSADSSASYNSVLDTDGTIVVYAGNCKAGTDGSTLWRFTPDKSSSHGQGTWAKQTFSTTNIDPSQQLLGANFLATPITFSSSTKEKDSNIYVFGGMCPYSFSDDKPSTWTSKAQYSDQMLHFQPETASSPQFILLSEKGQPISEAGFSLTPLLPTYSSGTDGATNQEQDFLLIGGHTQTAFINMTQMAVFSLPQATWNFVNVALPRENGNLLNVRNTKEVEPRSGHTATLSEDGSKIIIFGGWVGDVGNPANPQVAILELGIGYGGTGNWVWSIPSTSNSPIANDKGVYGHGAIMLPGNILMVTGGYQIQETTGSNTKRTIQIRNVENYFFNVSSGKFLTSFNNGLGSAQTGGSWDGMSESTKKAGLGAGIAFGGLALIIATVFGCIYARKLREKRKIKEQELSEKDLGDLSDPRNRRPYEHYEVYGLDENPWSDVSCGERSKSSQDPYSWTKTNGDPSGWKNRNRREVERSGLDLDIPSPHRGLRKSAYGRGNHHGAPRLEDNRINRTSRNMHAIEEMDEEQSSGHPSRQHSQKRSSSANANSMPLEDPFKDPEHLTSQTDGRKLRHVTTQMSQSEPVSPISPAEERQKEMTEWIKHWSAAGTAIQQGRHSPDKSDRTSSDLSDRSQATDYSSSRSAVTTAGPSRAASSKSGKYLPSLLPALLNPFAVVGPPSPTKEPSETTSHSGASRPSTAREEDSFKTAKSTFSQLNIESEALLGRMNTTYPAMRPDASSASVSRDINASHSRNRSGSTSRLGTWVGTVKRAIPASLPRVLTTAAGRSASMTGATLRPGGIGADGFPVYSNDIGHSTSSSPNKRRQLIDFDEGGAGDYYDDEPAVRRTVSDGANFWVSKRGAHDWDFEPASPSPPKQQQQQQQQQQRKSMWRKSVGTSAPATWGDATVATPVPQSAGGGVGARDDTSDDWDVEAAAEGRCVQIMFTVPRERLRVVNADVDGASVSEVGEGERNEDGEDT